MSAPWALADQAAELLASAAARANRLSLDPAVPRAQREAATALAVEIAKVFGSALLVRDALPAAALPVEAVEAAP